MTAPLVPAVPVPDRPTADLIQVAATEAVTGAADRARVVLPMPAGDIATAVLGAAGRPLELAGFHDACVAADQHLRSIDRTLIQPARRRAAAGRDPGGVLEGHLTYLEGMRDLYVALVFTLQRRSVYSSGRVTP